LSTQAKLIGVLVAALFAVLTAGFVGLRALRAANTDLKAESADQMQPLVNLGTAQTLVLENRTLLLQAEADRDSSAVPRIRERIDANETTIAALLQAYAARATADERVALDRFNADHALWLAAMSGTLEALGRADFDAMRRVEQSEARTHVAATLADLAALGALQQAEAATFFQQALARASFGIRLITGSVIARVLVAAALGLALIRAVRQALQQARAMESELTDAAWRDKLTGLANRALFMERLQAALERGRDDDRPLFAVLFLDFDHFKLLNDTLGHKAGDELLKQIAQRLQGALSGPDTIGGKQSGNLVARMGGDEFLILVDDLKTPDDACLIADRLLTTLAPVYQIFGSEVHSTASVGIVTSELGGASAEEMVRNADVAMYEAKRAGRACSVVFNEAMHVRLTRHAMIEASLRRAIGTPELYLVYQPIVELDSGRMVSVEALARWNHPTLGALSPAEFIPIAEGSGLIVAIGEWVLRQSCLAMLDWLRQDPLRAPRTISVNVSRAELALGPRLIDRLRGTLQEVGLAAEHLQLEITEREVTRNPKASLEALHGLRGVGVRLAMDDFGTGASSLAFLREYPFDTIKIDRSFLKGLTTSRDVLAVIHATVNLVGNLDMVCVAEGVEEPAQVAVLQSLGCACAQGYLFGRPVTADKLLGTLESQSESQHALG
jgi:diguanylate cyclase (GGDEF)-like protein